MKILVICESKLCWFYPISDKRSEFVLPNDIIGDWPRYFILLGGSHGNVWSATNWCTTFQGGEGTLTGLTLLFFLIAYPLEGGLLKHY